MLPALVRLLPTPGQIAGTDNEERRSPRMDSRSLAGERAGVGRNGLIIPRCNLTGNAP
jgi:hypothetical protein